ncbi:MAG TPA: hypothetical protein VLE97_10810 [Gaiellaceae bacterium]|nr:hypothetical protein [Gaiellaceae bacterium]
MPRKSKKQLDREINRALRGRAAKKSVSSAVDDAMDAFWASIAASYPQATSGDISPGTLVPFKRAAQAAVEEWVWANVDG